MLNVGPVNIAPGKLQVGFNGFTRVIRIADDQSAHNQHFVLVQIVDGLERGVAVVVPVGPVCVLGLSAEESQVTVQNIFDSQKDVAKSGLTHKRRQGLAMRGDGGRHGLEKIVELVETGIDDGAAERLKAVDVQGDVVIHNKEGAGAVVAGIADIRQHTVKTEGMKVAATHLNDRAEAAIVCAAPRGLNHVHLASHQRVAFEHAGGAIGQTDITALNPMSRPVRVMHPLSPVAIGEAADLVQGAAVFQRAQQVTKCNFAFTAHDVVHTHFTIGLWGKAGIVTAHSDLHARLERPRQFHDASGGTALKGHDGKTQDVRVMSAHELGDGLANTVLYKD